MIFCRKENRSTFRDCIHGTTKYTNIYWDMCFAALKSITWRSLSYRISDKSILFCMWLLCWYVVKTLHEAFHYILFLFEFAPKFFFWKTTIQTSFCISRCKTYVLLEVRIVDFEYFVRANLYFYQFWNLSWNVSHVSQNYQGQLKIMFMWKILFIDILH